MNLLPKKIFGFFGGALLIFILSVSVLGTQKYERIGTKYTPSD